MASKTVTVLLALAASVGARAARLETKEEMIAFLSAHPSRAYFSRLIRDGPYDVAIRAEIKFTRAVVRAIASRGSTGTVGPRPVWASGDVAGSTGRWGFRRAKAGGPPASCPS